MIGIIKTCEKMYFIVIFFRFFHFIFIYTLFAGFVHNLFAVGKCRFFRDFISFFRATEAKIATKGFSPCKCIELQIPRVITLQISNLQQRSLTLQMHKVANSETYHLANIKLATYHVQISKECALQISNLWHIRCKYQIQKLYLVGNWQFKVVQILKVKVLNQWYLVSNCKFEG